MIHLLLLMLACGSETEDVRAKLSPKVNANSEVLDSSNTNLDSTSSSPSSQSATPKGLEGEPEFATRLSSLETAPKPDARKTVSLAQLLANRHSQLVSTYGPPRVVGMGILTDADWCRELFPYSDRLSKLLELDFAQLAGVESRLGVVGVSRLVDHLPKTDERYAELKYLLRLIELTDTRNLQRVHQLLLRIRSPNLTDREQLLLYMDMMLEGMELRKGPMPKKSLDPLETPYSALVSNVTGLPYETLSFMESKEGTRILLLLVGTVPFWVNRDQTLSILKLDREEVIALIREKAWLGGTSMLRDY